MQPTKILENEKNRVYNVYRKSYDVKEEEKLWEISAI